MNWSMNIAMRSVGWPLLCYSIAGSTALQSMACWVLRNAFAVIVHAAEIVLGHGMSLLGGDY
jgi:hypothetical protein